jgi:CRP-like cAMP-binding protein
MTENQESAEPNIGILWRKGLNLDNDEKNLMVKKIDILANNLDKRPSTLLKEKSLGEFKRGPEELDFSTKRFIQFKTIMTILQKPKLERTKTDIKILSQFMCDRYSFFKKLREESDNDKLEACLKVLNYERFEENTNIINYGEIGDKFYIILTGTIGIYKHKIVKQELTMKQFMEYLQKIKYKEKNELKLKRVEDANVEGNISLIRVFDYDPNRLVNTVNYRKIYNIEVEEFVGEKCEGEEFGEVALAQKINRTATVRTQTYCDILSIERTDYNLIIRELEEKKFNGKIEGLRKNYPIIMSWHKQTVIKLMTFFKKVKVFEGETVYEQYEEADYIYFIINGSYEISTCLSLKNCSQLLDYITNAKANILNQIVSGENTSNFNYKNLKENASKYFITLAKINGQPPGLVMNPKNRHNFLMKLNTIELIDDALSNNDPAQIHSGVIRVIKSTDIIGLEDSIEFKKRFTTVKCISSSGELYKISMQVNIKLNRIL